MQRIKASNLNRGLVGAWCPSVAGDGFTLPDLSGYGNHGTLTNPLMWSRNALRGFQLYTVSANNKTSFPATLSCWFLENAGIGTHGLFSIGSGAGDNDYFGLSLQTGKLSTISRGNSYQEIIGGVSYGTTTWNHACCVYANNSQQLYLNGVKDAGTATLTTISSVAKIIIADVNLKGAIANGFVDDLRVYNRALSPSEIKQLYEGGPGFGLRVERKRSRFAVKIRPRKGARSVRKIDKGNLKLGLVGAWCPSVAGNGLLLPDLSGYGNHGTLTGMDASDWVGTDKGRALDFDGVDDFINTSCLVSGFNCISASAWINLGSVGVGNKGIIGRWNSPATDCMLLRVSTATLQFFLSDGTSQLGGNVSAALSTGIWYHVTATYDGATIRGYLNGLQFATTYAMTGVLNTTSTRVLFIGGGGQSMGSFLGTIDDARIYNRALSPSEIKQLYEGGPGFGLRQERKRSRFQVQGFNAGRFRRQQLIGTGVY